MAIPSAYLASENSAFERRSRALHRFLVGSPVALLIAVGLVGHVHRPSYRQPASDDAYDQSVMAYRERVVAAQVLRKGPAARDTQILAEARAWVAGYRAGTLVPIAPAFYEDHLRDGVRGEIFRTGSYIASETSLRATRDLVAGRAQAAAEEGIVAAETAHGLRNFEVHAHLQSLLAVRRGLGIVLQAWPSVSVANKKALRPRLAALATPSAEVNALVDSERARFDDYLRRRHISAAKRTASSEIEPPNDKVALAAHRSVEVNNVRIAMLLRL